MGVRLCLFVDRDQALSWSDADVVVQWQQLFSAHPLAERFLHGSALSKTELKIVTGLIDLWRERLLDISWYMRCLNEAIARQANQEDGCSGRFLNMASLQIKKAVIKEV